MDNYRSISLRSILGKCQERMVYSAIYSHVSAFLSDWQHGFVKGRSTATQLMLTHRKCAKALDKGHQVDVVFLDFSKAFDCVPHQALLHKLCNFGIISGEMLNWCQDYLSNRRQRVVIDNYSSSWAEITSGVPGARSLFLGHCFLFCLLKIYLMQFVLQGGNVQYFENYSSLRCYRST